MSSQASRLAMSDRTRHKTDALLEALRKQGDGDAHDRGLIVERLGWTPEERLDANAAFLRFYFSVRPQGHLIRELDEPAPGR